MKHLIFFNRVAPMLVISFILGAMLAIGIGIPEQALYAGVAATALNFVPKGLNLRGQLNIITATDVVTEWGALYRKQDQSTKDIINKLMQRSVTEGYFPVRLTTNTIMEKVSAEFARVLQRFQKAYTPIGGVTFKPLKIPLYKLKIDLAEYPDELEETWLGFLSGEGLDRKAWPFMKWFLMNALIQAEKDLELSEIYFGVPGSITNGTATDAGTSLKGIKKQINELNTASKLDKKVLGAVPTDAVEFVEYVEEMWGMTDRLLRNEVDFIFVNEDNHDLFRDGMREKYNTQYAQVDESKITKLRNDNVKLVGLPSMHGSNKIWFTPSWNRQAGFKRTTNAGGFQVENVDRLVKAYTDYSKGFGFWIGEYVVSNDVELT